MRKLFNEEQIKFIVENYQTMKYKDIANYLGGYKSEQIAGWLSNNGYKNKNRSIYTKYEQEFMRNNYKNMLYKDIAKKITINPYHIYLNLSFCLGVFVIKILFSTFRFEQAAIKV